MDVRCSLQTDEMHWLWATSDSGGESDDGSPLKFPETPVRVVYSIGEEEFAWDGILARYDGGGVDSQTRMIPCRAHVLQPQQVTRLESLGDTMASPPTLMVGMFVEVRIVVQPHRQLLRLPVAAVHPGNRVWVVDQGRLQPRVVDVAASQNGYVLVFEREGALRVGERVVISPLAAPRSGDEVVAREAP